MEDCRNALLGQLSLSAWFEHMHSSLTPDPLTRTSPARNVVLTAFANAFALSASDHLRLDSLHHRPGCIERSTRKGVIRRNRKSIHVG